MERFVQSENIRRFRERLAELPPGRDAQQIAQMLAASERLLARLNAGLEGVRRPWESYPAEQLAAPRAEVIAWFRGAMGEDPRLAALIDPAPGLVITAVNPTYEASSGRSRAQVEGQRLFDAFPDNPGDPAANGMRNLFASLREVADTGADHAMALQRYDVEGDDGVFVERWWRPVNRPLRDSQGRLIFILHLVEDATEQVLRSLAS